MDRGVDASAARGNVIDRLAGGVGGGAGIGGVGGGAGIGGVGGGVGIGDAGIDAAGVGSVGIGDKGIGVVTICRQAQKLPGDFPA